MSQENVELVKRAADAYNRRDVEALLEELHPDVELVRGADGVARRGGDR